MNKKTRYPIEENNFIDYIKREYPDLNANQYREMKLEHFSFLNQADFNEKLNCSLTSITACVNYYTQNENDINVIYKHIRRVACFFLYTPNLVGTLFATIGPIYSLGLRKYKVFGKQRIGLIKGIGFNKNKIIRAINAGHPVILSLFNDGRGFYKKHTITVVGYRAFQDKLFLIINDNWSNRVRYLDYQKLWVLSAVNYY